MILLHLYRFSVAAYHRRVDPEQADESLAQGLVVPVELTFEYWLNGKSSRAEAFLDPGADNTYLSLRWLSEQAEAAGSTGLMPLASPTGYIKENIKLSMGGYHLSLGDSDRPVWIGKQGHHIDENLVEMPGCEDLLLGRDFITQHDLLLLVDGGEKSFSLLLPADTDNNQRREQILRAYDPEQRFDQ